MKRSVVYQLLAAILVVLFPVGVLAVDPPHDPSNGYTCSTCHTIQETLGSAGLINVCLTCHRPGIAKGGKKPFTPVDAADPFHTFPTVRTGVLYQTSHNWVGSDNLPAAGALPPLSQALNSGASGPLMTVGTIACSRCHNPHLQIFRPFLRMANDRDQMCLDCHRVRNTIDHTVGTHPVNFNYTSAASLVKIKPAEFNNPPLNSNPSNPTSAMKLAGGTVLCTTCHGVHYADSDSSTFDGYSTYNKLKPSAGYLLRTDLRGATAAAPNICTNCHIKQNHNGRSQNVQCADCHAGHVDLADGTVANTYLVRRYMNVSTASGSVRNRKVLFQYTSVTAGNYKDANGTGVCQACHAVPTGGSYPSEHSLATAPAGVCNGCHFHNNPTGAFSAVAGGCTSCHGYPPKSNTPAGPDGYAAAYSTRPSFSDESRTPHASHAGGAPNSYACNECHKGNTHNSGTFQDVFMDKSGIVAGPGAAYDPAARSCNTVYCHSNGAPRGGTLTYQTVVWPNGKGTIAGVVGECGMCHEALPTSNVHGKHLSRGYGCISCHAATVASNTTISDMTRHVDGVKTVVFSTADPLTSATVWNEAAATCTGGKCHSDGSGGAPLTAPNWLNAASGACGSCHAAVPATNAHNAHFTTPYGPNFGTLYPSVCQNCHVYTTDTAPTHVNGTVDAVAGAGSACANCHPAAIPPWTIATRLVCTSCHAALPSVLPNGVAAPYKANFGVTGHGRFPASNQCTSCHDQDSPHISGKLGGYKRLSLPDDNSLCASCHNDAGKVPTPARQKMVSHVLVKGGAAVSDCKSCHDIHGTTNLSMVKTSINGKVISFTSLSSGFVKTVPPFDGLCQACHTATNHYRAGQAPDGHPTGFCLSCHNHKAAFAFQPSGACDTCHGYPPASVGFVGTHGNYSSARAEDYPGGGGAHLFPRHVKKTARPSEGWANCAQCHSHGSLSPATHTMVLPVTPSRITIDVADRYKFNPLLQLGPGWYSGILLDGGANATGSCTNVKCHFKPSKKWSTVK
ncbi:cytochrome c3 family protein [Geotalea uraniireducens]|uniref:Cytochrome C family protein n=1 Tax=Geotalea uraniireducens (strain Rf4) TaxID=351605 RepID=A5G716_GEOUR|nr:CxxxxCH/CxxCH domain-containing protein [Geotalea uraniireducens]ABQ27584.1 cytochrome C family protein [Geotalea uraniireducens Rf4]